MFWSDFPIQRRNSVSKCCDRFTWLVIKIPQKKHESAANSRVPTNQSWVDASVWISEYDKTLFSLNIFHVAHIFHSSGAAAATTKSRQRKRNYFYCLSAALRHSHNMWNMRQNDTFANVIACWERRTMTLFSVCLWEIVHSNRNNQRFLFLSYSRRGHCYVWLSQVYIVHSALAGSVHGCSMQLAAV